RRQLATEDDGFAAVTLGVGRLVGEKRLNAGSLTTSAENGDFTKLAATRFGIMLSHYPVVVIVKKHRQILNNLRDWLLDVGGVGDPMRLRSETLLLIYDEADNASVNTIDPRDWATGELDPDIDPSKVNGAIRELLTIFDRKAYVGYTATPYANLYIEPDAVHP